jgi:hypothetical protein
MVLPQTTTDWYSEPCGSPGSVPRESTDPFRLTKAGLGTKLGQRDKLFSFQPSKFESFRSEFMIQDACETTRRSVKGMKAKQWFVRLGSQYYGDLSDPGTEGRAPRCRTFGQSDETSRMRYPN